MAAPPPSAGSVPSWVRIPFHQPVNGLDVENLVHLATRFQGPVFLPRGTQRGRLPVWQSSSLLRPPAPRTPPSFKKNPKPRKPFSITKVLILIYSHPLTQA